MTRTEISILSQSRSLSYLYRVVSLFSYSDVGIYAFSHMVRRLATLLFGHNINVFRAFNFVVDENGLYDDIYINNAKLTSGHKTYPGKVRMAEYSLANGKLLYYHDLLWQFSIMTILEYRLL